MWFWILMSVLLVAMIYLQLALGQIKKLKQLYVKTISEPWNTAIERNDWPMCAYYERAATTFLKNFNRNVFLPWRWF